MSPETFIKFAGYLIGGSMAVLGVVGWLQDLPNAGVLVAGGLFVCLVEKYV